MSMKKIRYCFRIMLLVSIIFYTMPVYAAVENPVRVFYVNDVKGNDTNDGLTPRRAFKTINRAKQAAETAVYDSDVTVKLSDGIYYVNDGLNFTANNTGKYKITFCPQMENGNVTVSGGCEITGFEIFDAEKNIYRAPWSKSCRQLYINGIPATRARSRDNMGFVFNTNTMSFESTNKEILSWKNVRQAELVFKKEFVSRRVMIDSVEENGGSAVIKMKESTTYTLTHTAGVLLKNGESPWYIENVYELLDEGGEWYHDGEYIYYKPLDGETIESAVVSGAEKPINIAGTAQNPVSGLLFKNITFSHGSWMLPTVKREFIDSQNNYDGNRIITVPAVVNIEYGEQIEFDRCTFKNSGANGLNIMTGSKNIVVLNSEFYNLSAVGIQIGTLTAVDGEDVIEDIAVRNNKIHDCGTEYRSASGLAYVCAKNSVFEHNEIYDLPYSGIHTGWGWNYWKNTATEGIKIKYNYIHDCMRELEDGGLIYTLGGSNVEAGQKGSYNEIAYNYLKDTYHQGGAIYNDEGSSYWSVHHNVISQSAEFGSISWYNAAPNTNHLINQFNYSNTNNLDKFRSNDSILKEMIENNTYYEGEVSDYTAKIVCMNAGCGEKSIYTLDELVDTAKKNNIVNIGQGFILNEGGSFVVTEELKGKTINFCVITDGDLEIRIDETQSLAIGKDGVTFSEGGVVRNNIRAETADVTAVKNLSFTMLENRLILELNNNTVIDCNTDISEGYIEIVQKNGRSAIGSLIREYSYYRDRISSAYYDVQHGDNVVANGYFERNIRGWNKADVEISHEKKITYNDSLGSMKVCQNVNSSSSLPGYTYANVTFAANKWYRISSAVYVERTTNGVSDEIYREDAQLSFYIKADSGFYSDGWKKDTEYYREKAEHRLKSGWNYISMYIFADANMTVPVFPVIQNINGIVKSYIYYIDDFSVCEETPQISDCGFSQGIGQSVSPWRGWGVDIGYSEDFGYKSNDSIFFDSSDTASYHKPIKCVYLKPGKTYRMRAKLYVDSTVGSPSNKQIYLGIIDDYTTNTPDRHIGCAGGEIRLKEWVSRDVTFTWNAKTNEELGGLYEAYVCIFFENGVKGKCYIDDFELFEVSAQMPRTQNKDFINGLTAWDVTGAPQKIICSPGNGAEVFSKDSTAVLKQDAYILKNFRYYVSALVCLNDYYESDVSACIELKPYDIDNSDVIANGCMSDNKNGIYRTARRIVDDKNWIQIGGYTNFCADDCFEEGFAAELSLDIRNANNQPIHYSVKDFQIIPADDYKSGITEVLLSDDGKITYMAEGKGKIRYRYLINDNSDVKVGKSGYINIGEELPVLEYGDNETAAAELTSFAENGDECRIFSNYVQNVDMPSVAVSEIKKSDSNVQISMICKNHTASTMPSTIYMVEKNEADGRLISVQCQPYEISVYDVEKNITFDMPKEGGKVSIYCWNDLMTPFCGAIEID